VSEQVVEGVDGTVVHYRERVGLPWGVWAAMIFVTASLGVAYAFATTWWIGAAAFAVSGGLAAWGMSATTPLVVVDDRVVRAGRARLPLSHLGEVTALDAPAAQALRGRDADARAFLCLRPFVETGVRLDVDDPRDPHPYWLVSTRHPEQVVAAVRAALAAPGRAG
jgi:hypothetical protein